MQTFTNQYVRDLAWVVGSAPLLNRFNNYDFLSEAFFSSELNKLLPLLMELDKNPSDLIMHLEKGNTRLLGKYFESLVEFWLRNSEDKELLAHNLQVFKGRNTIGEFDFIYRDLDTKKVYHLECAGKFYIAHKNIPDHSNFIGPNSIDNLERKALKITEEQIKLSETAAGKETLLIEDITEKIIPRILLKGYIFYYADLFFNNIIVTPSNSNSNHSKGWWIFAKDIDYFLSGKKSNWVIVERAKWISSIYNPDESVVFSTNNLVHDLKKYFQNNNYPLLIAEVSNNDGRKYQELSRGFVVPDSWPKQTLY